MRRMALVIALLLLSLTPAASQEPPGLLTGITDAHNTVRQNLNNSMPPVENAMVQPVPVPPLQDFTWNNEVAAGAQAWADRCVFEHSKTDLGENIALGHSTAQDAVNGWASEVHTPGYDYANNQCPTGSPSFPGCGHYTQVVWSTSLMLGCGVASCPTGNLWVCRYQPAGNVDVNNTRPYCTATQTTGCQMGPDGGTCSAPTTPLSCGSSANGSTVAGGTSSLQGYSCGRYIQSGPDAVFSLTTSNAGDVIVTLSTPLGADLDLYVLSNGCDPSMCVGHSASASGNETVTFQATQGATYHIVVEDFNSAGADFTVQATCP